MIPWNKESKLYVFAVSYFLIIPHVRIVSLTKAAKD